MEEQIMKQNKRFIIAIVALLTCVAGAWAQGKVKLGTATNVSIEVKVGSGDFATLNATGTAATADATIMLKVTPSDGYYIENTDITLTPSAESGAAQAPRRRVAGPDIATVSLNSPSDPTDLSSERTYTFSMPSNGASVIVDAVAKARTDISSATVTATAKDYTGSAQVADDITVTFGTNTLTEGTDYDVIANTEHAEAGAYTITVQGKSKYTGNASGTFTINKVAPTITTAPAAKDLTYSGSAQQLITAGAVTGGTLWYKLGTSEYSTDLPVVIAATTYTVYYKVVGDANHTDIAETAITGVEIKKTAPTYTAPVAAKPTYSGAAQSLVTAGSTSDGNIYYQLADGAWTETPPTATNAGNYTVNWKLTGDENHTDVASTAVADVSIAQKAVTVSGITASNKAYDGTPTATIDCSAATISGKVGSDNLTVTATGTFIDANAGEDKTVNISGLTLAGTSVANYTLAATGQQASTTANITKVQLTATADNKSRAYNEENPTLTVTVTGFVNSETAATAAGYTAPTASTTATASSAVGTYDITVSGGAATNYTFSYVNGTLTVTNATATITAEATQSTTYNGSAQALEASVSAGSITVTYYTNSARTEGATTTAPTNAGTYYATVSQATAGYTSTPVNVTFTINKADLSSVTISDIAGQVIGSGETATPTYSVTINDNAVALDEYTASWTNNDKAGTATLTLTARDINFGSGTTATKDFTIKRRLNITLNGGRQKWASYYAAEDLAVPAGAKAYRVTAHDASSVTVEEVDYIQANTGVLLNAAAAVEGTALEVAASTGTSYTSELSGTVAAGSMTTGTNYILYNGAFVLAEGTSLAANRCYLPVAAGGARELQIVFADESTGISRITTDLSEVEGAWYTVDGRKLQGKPTVKGLYIVNGKKVVVK